MMTSGATACTSQTFVKINIRNQNESHYLITVRNNVMTSCQGLAHHNFIALMTFPVKLDLCSYRKMDVIGPSCWQLVQWDAGDWRKVSSVDIVEIQVSLEIFVIPAQGAVDD
jgi:hypothetical protein